MSGEGTGSGRSGPARLAVLASGSGTNLQALLDRFGDGGDASGQVAAVIASSERAGALERARRSGVPGHLLDAVDAGTDAERIGALLEACRADLVVLAGYLRRVPAAVVRAYRGRMVNVHPALLPGFGGQGMYGLRVHRAVLEAGVRVTGVTVHFVDEHYDRGPIIAQWPVPVLETDDPETLAARVLRVEHRVLPAVVSALARGVVRLVDGRCRWTRPWFASERFIGGGDGPAE
jgi:formyltetrahydrofolate-dependent phosphoribosylglycinamide formyltransferase